MTETTHTKKLSGIPPGPVLNQWSIECLIFHVAVS